MKDFLKKIEDSFGIIEIEEKVSNKFEAAKILRQYPKDTVILKNVEGTEIPIISGICNTREKIALAIGCEVSEITEKIISAMENPKKINEISEITNIESYTSTNANLSKIPILTHYKGDGGRYITAGVIIAKDRETGIPNASIHRMLVLGDDRLTVRLVPRHLYTYHKKAEEMGKDLEVSIAIGMNPATLLATTTSVTMDVNELEVSNAIQNGEMSAIKCNNGIVVPESDIILEGKLITGERANEGPFVDLTDTYDVVRKEPVIKLDTMHIVSGASYHAISPAGFEHKLLQGIPQEPRILKAVKNTVPTVQNVVLTEGGCCWLHAVVSIVKQTQGDGKNIMMAALAAHPSLKHCVVVDDDVDIFDPQDVEYAIATRVKGDEDILIVPNARGSSLDPAALPDGTTTKVGVDATKPLDKLENFERVSLSE